MNKDHVLRDFGEFWSRKVDDGAASPMSRLEELAIRVFMGWLVKMYEVRGRDEPPEDEVTPQALYDMAEAGLAK
jgi:hypothetical protein